MKYLAFGKESSRGQRPLATTTYDVIPMGSGRCERCGAIRPLDELLYIATDEWGDAGYACRRPPPPRLISREEHEARAAMAEIRAELGPCTQPSRLLWRLGRVTDRLRRR